MADVKALLSTLAVKLAEQAAAVSKVGIADATEAFKAGINTAIGLVEQAAQKVVESRLEGHLRDRVTIVAMNLEGWASLGPPADLPMDAVDAYRYGLNKALKRIDEALKDQPMPLTGNADVAQVITADKLEAEAAVAGASPLQILRFQERGGRICNLDVARVVTVTPVGDAAQRTRVTLLNAPTQIYDIDAEELLTLIRSKLAQLKPAAVPPAPTLQDHLDALGAAKARPTFTKCEKLIYDAARQALADPSVMRTRAQLTQQIDFWLYQLQNANLARPKPEMLASGGTAG